MGDDDEIYGCDKHIPGNCTSEDTDNPYRHVCDLDLSHEGRHYCDCGRNWADGDQELRNAAEPKETTA